MPRNHRRILQTSKAFLQTWRANCDVQIILYESDPDNPSPADIAKATDYIVGYACKGNESLAEEKAQIIQLILQSDDQYCTSKDVQRVARQILNMTVKDKMISKQEAMVLLGQLDLFECSESIETHSISSYFKISNIPDSTLVTKYAKRPDICESMSLYDFFFYTKSFKTSRKLCIPHFVGASSQPCYPISKNYAKSTLIIHIPWRNKRAFDNNPKAKFLENIKENKFPPHVSIPFHRMKQRYEANRQSHEPVNQQNDNTNDSPAPPDMEEFFRTINALPKHKVDSSTQDLTGIDLGEFYDWSVPNIKVRPGWLH